VAIVADSLARKRARGKNGDRKEKAKRQKREAAKRHEGQFGTRVPF
jgi:uncharacterized low-complexity protein